MPDGDLVSGMVNHTPSSAMQPLAPRGGARLSWLGQLMVKATRLHGCRRPWPKNAEDCRRWCPPRGGSRRRRCRLAVPDWAAGEDSAEVQVMLQPF